MSTTQDSSTLSKAIATAAIVLGIFTLLGSLLIAFTHKNTEEKIQSNQRNFILKSLNEVLPKNNGNALFYDNDILADSFTLLDTELSPSNSKDDDIVIYPAFKQGRAVGAIITSIVANGYNGKIKVLVGIQDIAGQAKIVSSRVVEHRETPGLGDPIEAKRSNWIFQFDGKSLNNPPLQQWQVKKDGGDFDQLTGATITPRAVTQAIKQALLYYETNHDSIFSRHTVKVSNAK